MADSFDAFEYFRHLRKRWWYCVIACGASVVTVLAGCAFVTKQYSATASILIDPPASSDVRTAVAVSPVYLESLRTYEYFASSDSLFQRAAEQFHLRDENPAEPIERLKKRVLKVSKLRDTKILEITVTLPDPKRAAMLASFLSAQTAALSLLVGREGDQDLIDGAQKQLESAEKALATVKSALQQIESRQSIEANRHELSSLIELHASVQRDLMQARADLAEAGNPGLQRRAVELAKQNSEFESQITAGKERAAQIAAKRDALDSDFVAALRERDALRERLRDIRSSAGMRGERLRVIDSGVVPQRPSSPNVPLIVMSAFLLSLVASLFYLSVGFSIAQRRRTQSQFTRAEHERRF